MTDPAVDAFELTLEVIHRLDRLGVPYLIGGSLASSVHGVPRSTVDGDLVVDLQVGQISPLVEAFKSDFYVEETAVRDAVQRKLSFQMIHSHSFFKFDMYVLKPESFHQMEFSRRRQERLDSKTGETAYLATPEDILLTKLDWFRQGGETSERQWNDVLGILHIQKGKLDPAYLNRWAAELGVKDLLDRALGETR